MDDFQLWSPISRFILIICQQRPPLSNSLPRGAKGLTLGFFAFGLHDFAAGGQGQEIFAVHLG